MRHAARARPSVPLDAPFPGWAGELARVALAIGVYLALLLPFKGLGIDRMYGDLVLRTGQAVLLPLEHFPLLSRLDNLTLSNLDFLVVLTVALFVVSTRIPLAARIRRFGGALTVIFALHVVAAYLTIKLRITEDLLASHQILVLLPVEFRVLAWVKYLLYDMGAEIGPFAMLFAACLWNSGGYEAPRFGRAAKLTAACTVVVLVASAAVYARAREHDPRHVETHAKLGHLFWKQSDDGKAQVQYRAAIAGRTTDPQVYYNLAGIDARYGRGDEAIRMLNRGMDLSQDPVWKARFLKAMEIVQRPRGQAAFIN